MTSNAQTEARAIAERWYHEEWDGSPIQLQLVEMIATALAAKDADREKAVTSANDLHNETIARYELYRDYGDCLMDPDREGKYVLYEDHATALAAKDAELAEAWQRYVDANEARIDAEAALAEARKALEPFSNMAGEMFARGWDASNVAIALDNPDEPHRVTAGDFFAARRALTGGQEDG